MGAVLAAIATIWHQAQQREKEKQLLFIGKQFSQAIGSYYENTPPDLVKQFPKKLEDLLEDKRFLFTRRYLRRIYYDPFTNSTEWGLVKGADDGIIGVYSMSDDEPVKKANFGEQFAQFENNKHYSGWQFVYAPGTHPVTQPASPDGAGSASVFPPVQTVTQASGNGQTTGAIQNPNSTGIDKDYSKKSACLGQRVSDTAACTFYCEDKGIGPECRQCQASILSRYSACLKGDSLPPLAGQ